MTLPQDDPAFRLLTEANGNSKYATPASVAATYATKATLKAAGDPLAYLNSIDILCSWDTRPAGSEATYPQGISINEAAGEIYVANQDSTTLLRIDIRNLDGTLKSSKSLTVASGSFTEALPYWYNGSGQLCFIVRAGAGADPVTGQDTYSIYNYTTGTLGSPIPIQGRIKADVDGNFMITSDVWTQTISKIWVYDWASVKAGTPSLLNTINVAVQGATVAKNQGLVLNGGYIFVLQGAAGTSPTITVYNVAGQLVNIYNFAALDFAAALNAVKPGTITNLGGYTYENEGGCKYQGKLATLEVVNNTADIVNSKSIVVLHNVIGGVKMPVSLMPYVHDTGWIDLPLTSPFVAYTTAQAPKYRREGNRIEFTGGVKGLATAPASNIVANLPAEFRPLSDRQFTQMSSAGYTTNWQIGANGDLKLLQTRDTAPGASTWYPLPAGTYRTN